jgi:gluconokinase
LKYRNKIGLLSIDIGTTRSKAMFYTKDKGIVSQDEESYPAYYPKPGFVEQNPEEVFAAVLKLIKRIMSNSNISSKAVTALCLGGVYQSLIPVDINGNALSNAILWSDSRSLIQNERLRAKIDTEEYKKQTGCSLHPIYFPSRILWLKEKMPEIYNKTAKFISIKEYIIHKIFGVFQVDHSIASGTGLWNMHKKSWDQDILTELKVKETQFSESIEPVSFISKGLKGEFASITGLLTGTPCIAGASDGALSHLGSAGVGADRISLTVGTGAALRKSIFSPSIISNSEAWCYYLADDIWLAGGVLLNAGNVFRWFADNLMPYVNGIKEIYKLMDKYAAEAQPGSDGLLFIPLLNGERSPEYRPDAKGVIYGFTLAHSRSQITRSMMEGLAYNIYTVYKMLSPDFSAEIFASGGSFNSAIWLKLLSDFLGKDIWMPKIKETAAWGGIILGLKAVNDINSIKESVDLIDLGKKQQPEPVNKQIYQKLIIEYEIFNKEIHKFEKMKKTNMQEVL